MKKLLLLLFLIIPQFGHAVLPNYCRRFQLPGWWGSAEYMVVWRKKRYYPALVTTSPLGTSFDDAGILGLPTTRILFGDEHVGESPQSGGRFDAGFWLTPCLGFGATWTAFGKEHVNYKIESNSGGIPIIAVPFSENGIPDAYLVAFPNGGLGSQRSGELNIHTTNNIWAADLYARWHFWSGRCWYADLLGGFRYSRLTDNFDLTTTRILADFPFVIGNTFDNYNTENTFYSGLIGAVGEYRKGRWEILGAVRCGIGNMVRKTTIFGEVIFTDTFGDFLGSVPGGILTTPINIGSHPHNSFEVVTEAEAHLGVYVWSNLMLTAGYHFMYWPKIFLAGDQIQTDFEVDAAGAVVGPRFTNRESNFWTQSLTVGIYFLY